jgi:hypothetical protein
MGIIAIELADRIEDQCSCCRGRLIRLTRFVSVDGNAHAVYYADFSPDHADGCVRVILSLGAWGGWDGGKVPKKRAAFAFEIGATDAEYQTTVVDARESPWQDVKELGRLLDRKTALAHPWIKEVFRIADRIVELDSDVRGYLDRNGPGPDRRNKKRPIPKRKRK